MAKRPDSMETLKLTHELLRRIPKGRTITAPELQQQLADIKIVRDMRTIQRQLKSLCEFYDIECDESTKPHRYCWKERAKGLSLPCLSAQESLLLLLAEQQLSSMLPAKLMKSMEGFFIQARSQLGDKETTKREREWLEKVRVVSTSQPLLPPKIDPAVFEQVSNALYAVNQRAIFARKQNGLLPSALMSSLITCGLCCFASVLFFYKTGKTGLLIHSVYRLSICKVL